MDAALNVLLLGQRRFHELSMRGRVVLSQLPLNLTMLLVSAIVAYVDPAESASVGFAAGQAAAVALFAICALVPWGRLPYGSFLAIPILDFIPVGLVRSSAEEVLSGIGLLAVFPMMWLAGSGYRPRIMLSIGTLACLLMVWLPPFLVGDATPSALVAELVTPFMILCIGAGTSIMTLSGMAQQERVEELLERSVTRERLLDTVLDSVDVGVLVIDDLGKSTFLNPKQRQLYVAALPEGLPTAVEADLLMYRDETEELVPPAERPLAKARAGLPVSHEVVRLGRGPEARTISVSGRTFDDAAGERAGTVLVSADVTDVVAAVRARDMFLASMSHEFRTPLTNLVGYAELLQDDPSLSAAARSDLLVMVRNARHLNKMVDDILAAATPEADPVRMPLDLGELVREAAASSGPEASSRGIALDVAADVVLPVLGDRTGLVRILDNLLSNALKYSESGSTIALTASQDGSWAVCTVRDQGFGIDPHDLEHVFTRFQRSAAAVRAGIPGTGLGLALAKEVAEQHGGGLECESELGVGSVFTLRIPLRGQTAREEATRSSR
ncbi:ATP-binding protein [Sinomonas sp. JGH33]|uniref:histidine kinase n=1 Tax=Sinomonas terricola TaxID=3110330 RepID=A0ABU5T527_9MICC|nr:ATP-binding protein [Sinomonas sp. JGH33]MEA5454619.1 ATP-binding protein [Sinomonas sp. JGH33]